MAKKILHVLLDKRHDSAVDVQKVLTEYGCSIKTRVGLHDATPESCSDYGLIILELIGDTAKHAEMEGKLAGLDGVTTKMVEL